MEEPLRIVIVEDEADVARYISAALSDEGYEVHVGASADEGVFLIHAHRPHAVCLDLVMPGRTGISLYRELRKDPALAHLPIIVVTGVAARDAEDDLGLGDDLPAPSAFIEKPLDLPKLLRAVEAACGRNR